MHDHRPSHLLVYTIPHSRRAVKMTSDNAYLLSCGCQRAAPISPLSLSVSNKHLFDIFFPFIFLQWANSASCFFFVIFT